MQCDFHTCSFGYQPFYSSFLFLFFVFSFLLLSSSAVCSSWPQTSLCVCVLFRVCSSLDILRSLVRSLLIARRGRSLYERQNRLMCRRKHEVRVKKLRPVLSWRASVLIGAADKTLRPKQPAVHFVRSLFFRAEAESGQVEGVCPATCFCLCGRARIVCVCARVCVMRARVSARRVLAGRRTAD